VTALADARVAIGAAGGGILLAAGVTAALLRGARAARAPHAPLAAAPEPAG
jgi:hypothetical protein